jgi:hypothetical protein
MICLMMMSSASSQKLSNDSVIVPIKALKNALLVKADRDNLKLELGLTRDSIKHMDTIILRQDSIIKVCDSTRVILDKKIEDYKGVVKAKDGIIEEKDKKISNLKGKLKGVMAAFVLSTISLILSLAL